jgi:hypothetical protein
MNGREKRREARIPEEIRAAIEVPKNGSDQESPVINAFTRDISLGGARIMTNELFPTGAVLKLTLYLSRSRQAVRILGEVRWSRMIEAELFEMGVEFRHEIPLSVMALITHLYGKKSEVPSYIHAKPGASANAG